LSEEKHYTKKRVKQKKFLSIFTEKPINYLIQHNISPNILSYLGFIFSIIATIFIGFRFSSKGIFLAWIPPFLIFFSGAFDILDGAVARRTNKANSCGAFLDSNLDRLSDAVLLLGLIYGKLIEFLVGYILLFLTLMISYTRARAETEGVNMKGIGLMERADRIIILIIALSIEGWIFQISYWMQFDYSGLFFTIFICLYMILLIITLLHRIMYTFKSLRKKDIKS